jgi:hypothetical protein
MKLKILTTTLVILLIFSSLSATAGDNAPMLSYCWANGVIYGIVFPTNAGQSGGMRNMLYVFRSLTGQRPVAEAAPGDANYQNGRFQTVFLDFTSKGIDVLDPDHDGMCEFEITNAQMIKNYLDQGYLTLGGRAAPLDIKLVSPDLYKNQISSPQKGTLETK